MSKTKVTKPSGKRSPSSKAAAAEREVEIVEKHTAKDVIAETETEEASAVEVTTKAFLEAEPAAAAEEFSPAEPAEAAGESTPAAPPEERYISPRRSVAFIGSECYPFVKTGGLGDVMYALPKALVRQNCDVKVILPRYKCIPWEYQKRMIYRGSFQMDLCADGRTFYVGIM